LDFRPAEYSAKSHYAEIYFILHTAKSIEHVLGNQPGSINAPFLGGRIEAAAGLNAVRVFAKVG
jgi:hypothetical protein